MKINSGQAPSTLIPEYIGSDFDKVITVADNLNDIKPVSENINDVVAVGDNILDVNTVAANVEDVTLVADNIDYVKDVAEGIEGLPASGYIGDTPPTQPKVGATWYCTLDGRNYTWYEDTDSGQWVESSPQSTADDPHLAGNIFTLWKRSAAEAGYNLVVGSFEEGGVLTSSTDVLLHKESKSIYAWIGVFPHTVAPGTDPAAVAGFVMRSDAGLRAQLTENGQTTDQIGMQTAIHHSGRVGYASLPRLVRSFVNYNDSTGVEIQVLGLGSSVGVGASLPDPTNQAPVKYLTQQLNDKFNKLGNKTITGYNRSVNGSTLTDGVTALADALAEPLTPKLTVLAFGMNDGNTAIYNAGQTYPFVYTRCAEIIEKAKNAGSDVVVLTTPHPHSKRSGWSMPAGIPQSYPTSVAAPVADSALIPSVANSVKNIDATGNGVIIPVSYRHMRVNEAMRRAAADCGVPVIDAEWYWFKAVGDKGEDALFNPREVVHPNLLGHQLSYWAAIDDFVDSLTASVVSGNEQIDYQQRVVAGLSASQSPLARNHLRQSAYANSEAIARFDNAAGDKGVIVNELGDVSPISTNTSSWVLPGNYKQKRQYATTSNFAVVDNTVIGAYNISTAMSVPIATSDSFELTVKAAQSGLSYQHVKVHGYNNAGTIALVQEWTQGATVVNITASGGNVLITPVAANTDLMYKLVVMHLGA